MRRYCGRDFSDQDLELIRSLIEQRPPRNRAELSRLTCRALEWYKADGGLKDMSCRVAMLRMNEDGIIRLPPPLRKRPQQRIEFTSLTAPQAPLLGPVHLLPPLQLRQVIQTPDSKLWNEFIHRYYYLGHKPS